MTVIVFAIITLGQNDTDRAILNLLNQYFLPSCYPVGNSTIYFRKFTSLSPLPGPLYFMDEDSSLGSIESNYFWHQLLC